MTSSLSEADFGVLGSRYSDATSHAVVPVADFRQVKDLDLRVCMCAYCHAVGKMQNTIWRCTAGAQLSC